MKEDLLKQLELIKSLCWPYLFGFLSVRLTSSQFSVGYLEVDWLEWETTPLNLIFPESFPCLIKKFYWAFLFSSSS